MRLDLYLLQNGYVKSRTEAKNEIERGGVFLDGKPRTKPGLNIDESLPHTVVLTDAEETRYASRGAWKLLYALDRSGLSPKGQTVLDIGASGGGFTDVLLRRGAAGVYALDCGCGQLAQFLRDDPRVTVMEHYNARYLDPADFAVQPQMVTMDVSFISQTLIHPAIASVLAIGGSFITLVKPQFEVGKSGVGKGGIVRNNAAREAALARVIASAEACGFRLLGSGTSPITGGDGNVEYLAWFRFDGAGKEE